MAFNMGASFRVGYNTECGCSCFGVAKLGFLEDLVGLSSKWLGMAATNLHNCKIGHLPPKRHDGRCHNFVDAKMTKVHVTPKHPNY